MPPFSLKNILILSLLEAVNIALSTGCSCGPIMPLAEIYCNVDYVIIAEVAGELSPPWQDSGAPPGVPTTTMSWIEEYNRHLEYTYVIDIKQTLRSTPKFESATMIIQSEGIGGCIARIKPGWTYLLMGWVSNLYGTGLSTLTLSMCDVIVPLHTEWGLEVVANITANPPFCYKDFGYSVPPTDNGLPTPAEIVELEEKNFDV